MDCLASLSSDFLSLLEDSTYGDLTIQCPGGEVSVHRGIMAARSPVFSTMLQNNMVEKTTGVMKIEDFDVDVVKAMVKYVYTARIDDEFEDIKDLLRIGNKYLIRSLVDICSQRLINSITFSNVVDLGVFAETYSVQNLVDKCSEFIASDMNSLGEDWEERVQNSPLFATQILKCLKSGADQGQVVEIKRFALTNSPSDSKWYCGGNKKDAINFQVNLSSKLMEVGLYGTDEKEEIPVDIEVKKGSTSVFSQSLTYESPGNGVPVKIPVNVEIDPNLQYTVSVLISASALTDHLTFWGSQMNIEKIVNGEVRDTTFQINFTEADDADDADEADEENCNGTDVSMGQIPTLVFKL
eukprot:GFUD01024374.1.p1 GENE.GFUD01024374.1~~GFUD01024374.1.p1  ORF type:complete len:354 (+),score=91.08 GFUD01024374.1:57-1118(+)